MKVLTTTTTPFLLAAIAPSALARPSPQTASSSSDTSTIDLQWTICDRDPPTVLAKLGLDPGSDPYKQNPITYYDSRPPRYTQTGVLFRTKVKKGRAISLIKVRFDDSPEDDETDDEGLVPHADECLWDRYGEDSFFTCARQHALGSVDDVEQGDVPLWSEEQVAFASQFRGGDGDGHDGDDGDDDEAIAWDQLVPYGPFENPKWKLRVAGFKAKFDSVMVPRSALSSFFSSSSYPSGTTASDDDEDMLHLMEVEAELHHGESDEEKAEAYRRITGELEARGVVLCAEQEGKTLRLFREMGFDVSGKSGGGEVEDGGDEL